jgi:hypothetical protein
MTRAQRPRYVMRSSEQAFCPPYLQAGCQLYGFWIRATPGTLQAYCERFVQAPSQGAVRLSIAWPYVLLYFCSFARTQSLHPSDCERGWLGENECGLWIPVTYAAGSAPPRLAFFPYMMFVDSGPAAISGRELLGFPKELGHITLPSDPARPSRFALDGLCFAQHGRDVAGLWSRLIELRISSVESRPQSLPDLPLAWPALRVLLRSLRWGRARIPLLLLKQVRDALEPERACHQSVLTCTPELIALRSLRMLGDPYQIDVHPRASHPIIEELGIEPSSLTRARGFATDLDFTLAATEIVWEAR